MQEKNKRKWVPEICYEDYGDAELTGGLPFIQVPKDMEVPDVIFMFASKDTGEMDVGLDGEPEPIVEMELYQYACMQYLQEELDPETYDQVRVCLGLLPLNEARKQGNKSVDTFVQNIHTKIKETKEKNNL
jgi:hypothetical protein